MQDLLKPPDEQHSQRRHSQLGFSFWEPADRPRRAKKQASRQQAKKPPRPRSQARAQAEAQPQPAPRRPRAISTLDAIEALIARCREFESTSAEDAPGWNPNVVAMFHLKEAHEAMRAFQFEQKLAGSGESNLHKPS